MPIEPEMDPLQQRRRTVTWDDPVAGAAAARGRPGIEVLRALLAGGIPPPPILRLMGIELVAVDPRRVTMRMPADECLYNPIGTVHGGALATLLDSVMGCAVHSLVEAGRGYTTLEIKVNYLRAVTVGSGLLTATGEVVHAGRQQAVAEGRVHDARGRLCASASTTCLLFDLPGHATPDAPAAG